MTLLRRAPAPPTARPVGGTVAAARLGALVVFLGAVVATPTRSIGTFGVHAAGIAATALVARVPVGRLRTAVVLELPVVVFAGLLPLLGTGPTVTIGPVGLSVEGLWGAWSVLARATLGVLASTILLSSTPVADVLDGAARLRLPAKLVAVAGFALRYGVVVQDDARRLRVARAARGDEPRWIWQARGLLASMGTLFVRSVERGERVHRAMLARGHDGSARLHLLDAPSVATVRAGEVLVLTGVPVVAWAAAVSALVGR